MTWAELEKGREEHFNSLDCRCPICNSKLKYVMMYEDYPQFFSGACKKCSKNYHFWKTGTKEGD